MPDFEATLADLAPRDRYKLLTAIVIPRPIAFVTTLGPDGTVNAAPFSFFNVFGEDPPLLVLGINAKAEGALKDTAAHIRRTGEFVVHLVDEALGEAMNLAAVDFPPEMSEPEIAGLALRPSRHVQVPRLEAAPFALECRRFVTLEVANGRHLIIGEVIAVHGRDGLVDPATLRIDLDAYHPVGRLFANLYARQREVYELRRESFAEWSAKRGKTAGE